jgi:hypothetical protein
VWASGGGQHVLEVCVECNKNARGSAIYVRKNDQILVGVDVNELPVWSNGRAAVVTSRATQGVLL